MLLWFSFYANCAQKWKIPKITEKKEPLAYEMRVQKGFNLQTMLEQVSEEIECKQMIEADVWYGLKFQESVQVSWKTWNHSEDLKSRRKLFCNW